jgi:hypothetical protein
MPTKKPDTDEPTPTKRRVTMRNVLAVPPTENNPVGVANIEATDYVLPEHLDAYMADARTRWAVVEVSDEPDAGPGGYHGPTYIPEHLDVPDAGDTRPASA